MKQREIKFRAWDSKRMLMGDEYDFYVTPNGKIKYLEEHSDRFGLPFTTTNNHQDVTLMQYTGLKDKNGVDIYEGDVIESKQWNPERYEVCFEEGEFGFKCGGAPYLNQAHYMSSFYVIGNIYENPELIDQFINKEQV